MLNAIYQSVFKPRSLVENQMGYNRVVRYGWMFIVVRWLYYSVLFLFRDYHGHWPAFVSPPFGLDIEFYADLQRVLALPFGLLLMFVLSLSLVAYLQVIDKRIRILTVLNILGVTFFLPFVLVQPIDYLFVAFLGWEMVPVAIVHTIILFWESWAAAEVIAGKIHLKVSEKCVGISVLTVVWMLITGMVWR